jgi:uncharacterized protein (TIGR03067 family)
MKPWLAVLVLSFLLIPFLEAADKDSESKDELQGKWKLMEVEKDGKSHKVKGQTTEYFEMIFKGNKVTARFKEGTPEQEGTYKFLADTKPKAIDFTPTTGDEKGKTVQGIYEIKGNKLKLCVAVPGTKRPMKFESKGEEIVVYLLERVKE